jgi:hypothetical protein
MKWYAAHLVLYFKRKNRRQKSFPVWENIVLVRARNPDEAFAKADRRGREELQGDDGTIRWNGHPVEMVFAGVRKIVLCQDEHRRPADGTEVSYTEMVFSSEAAIRRLVDGDSVTVTIDDECPDKLLPAAATHRIAE